jgi:hypothetical protein
MSWWNFGRGGSGSSTVSVRGSGLNNSLIDLLMAEDLVPGDEPSYQLCKTVYVYHPLGAKMAESPVSMAQSQERQVTVQDAPDEVVKAFLDQWEALDVDASIHNWASLSRVYGLSSIVMGSNVGKSDMPLDMTKIWEQDIYFNVWDPLNTSGSLVLNQVPTAADFNKPLTVSSNGQTYHKSRYQVMMNEHPVYIQYTGSAFGFVGRSVYQRALFPLKSFVNSMSADDMIVSKLGLLIAKMKAPGSIINQGMLAIAALKREMLKQGTTGNVMHINIDEMIETLDMSNVDGAGTYARTNILKNIATAADMPAKLLENETMIGGMAEGSEDAKNIARYIDRVRQKLNQGYKWFDNIVQYRAWNPQFYTLIQRKYPKLYGDVTFEEAFLEWRTNFSAVWPSFLIEPESEAIKTEQIKLEAVVSFATTFMPKMDPESVASVIQWAVDCIADNKRLFPHEIEINSEALLEFLRTQKAQQDETQQIDNKVKTSPPVAKLKAPASSKK